MGGATLACLVDQEHTLTHLDEYLEQFKANARSMGTHVHWARAAEHNVEEVFARTIDTEPRNSDVHYLAEAQREATRPLILAAEPVL